MTEQEDVADTYRAYLERQKQPMTVWRPVLTEQQKKELEQYIEEHKLPF
jgi:hypothetical protein